MIRLLEKEGWYLARTRGSHRQFQRPEKSGRVTVEGKPSDGEMSAEAEARYEEALAERRLSEPEPIPPYEMDQIRSWP